MVHHLRNLRVDVPYRFFGSEEESNREFEQMKVGLEEVLRVIPLKDDTTPEKMSAVSSAIEAFVKRFE